MLTLGTLRGLLRKVLDEIDVTNPDDRLEELEWALREFATHTAAERSYAVNTASGQITMGDDYLRCVGVLSSRGFLEPVAAITPGRARDDTLGWYEWPRGVINVLGITGEMTVYYYGYYPALTGDDDQVIPLPLWAVQPVIMLTAAFTQMPYSVTASSLAQWKTRMDSGGPEDNPLIEQVKFFVEQYERALAKHKPQEHDTLIRKGR
jgi:hypothetical protein